MDSNSKMRKGFMKGKLVMAFYRASKPSNTTQPYTTTTTTTMQPYTTTSTTNHNPPAASQKSTSLIMNQEKAKPQSKHVSYVIQETRGKYDVFDNPYGVVVDEGVDVKASVYISCVQERFKLEHVNTDQLAVEPTKQAS